MPLKTQAENNGEFQQAINKNNLCQGILKSMPKSISAIEHNHIVTAK
ncbi:MAG: hypothetical protein MI808_15115 [Pseudomonadales bacterium]|nr:hypothetical protein [Pseudomonadales bacterium]